MEKNHLEGIKEISVHVGWSKDKLIVMHTESHFPMKKIKGRWTSHKDLISKWFQEQLNPSS